METTLSKEYFTLIGGIQSLGDGEMLLEEHRIWSLYYSLIELRARDDIVKSILGSGNFAVDGHMRVIISKLLVAGYKEMRLYTTNFFITLIEQKIPGLEEWIPQILVPQIYDPAASVSTAALAVMKVLCEIPIYLKSIIDCNPDVEFLSLNDCASLYKFLGLNDGYQHLAQNGFIERETKYWLEHGIFQYVVEVELSTTVDYTSAALAKDFPPHFLGSLAQTKLGCDYLSTYEELEDITTLIIEVSKGLVSRKADAFKLKAAIWTLASIGSSETGLSFLATLSQDVHPLDAIVKLSYSCSILSVRGYFPI